MFKNNQPPGNPRVSRDVHRHNRRGNQSSRSSSSWPFDGGFQDARGGKPNTGQNEELFAGSYGGAWEEVWCGFCSSTLSDLFWTSFCFVLKTFFCCGICGNCIEPLVAYLCEDLSTLTADGKPISGHIPFDAIELETPADGLPCTSDFQTTCISFLFSGSRLYREPLDMVTDGSSGLLKIKKGFTRLILVQKIQNLSYVYVHICLYNAHWFKVLYKRVCWGPVACCYWSLLQSWIQSLARTGGFAQVVSL